MSLLMSERKETIAINSYIHQVLNSPSPYIIAYVPPIGFPVLGVLGHKPSSKAFIVNWLGHGLLVVEPRD